MFPGQGVQYVGMCKTLFSEYEIVKKTFDEASNVLSIDIEKLIFESSMSELATTVNSHISIFIASIAAFRVYMQEIGTPPLFLAGHSLGEYSALACSGVLSFSDALSLVYHRSKIIDEAAANGDGEMIIVNNVNKEVLSRICRGINSGDSAWISCYNSTTEHAVSVKKESINNIIEEVLSKQGANTPLQGSAPMHSTMMSGAANKLNFELMKYHFHDPIWMVISTVNGKPYSEQKVQTYLSEQMIMPVRWDIIARAIIKYKIDATIEFGPKGILGEMLKTDIKSLKTYCFDQKESRAEAFVNLRDDERSDIIEQCQQLSAGVLNQNIESEAYKSQVVDEYAKLRAMKRGEVGLNNVMESLKKILQGKRVTDREQEYIIQGLRISSGLFYKIDNVFEELKKKNILI